MIQGAIIIFAGIIIGYFFGYNKELLAESNKVIKQPFVNKKGIIVDVAPPIDLGDIQYEQEKTVK